MGALGRITLTTRLGLALLGMTLLAMVPQFLGMQGWEAVVTQLASLLLGAGGVLAWFHLRFSAAIGAAESFADDLAGCNLTSTVRGNYPPPLGTMIRALRQIQINLRAVVGDVRREIDIFNRSASEIAEGSMDLSARTESQASNLQETAASMEELASTVKQTADTAIRVSNESANSNEIATRGGQAVHRVSEAMQAIDALSLIHI